MTLARSLTVALLCFLAIPFSPAAELTPAATAAVNRLYPDATVVTVGQGRDDGVHYYEVVVRLGGDEIEIEVTPAGGIGEIARRVELADLPKEVREGISKATNGARIAEVDRLEVMGFTMGGVFRPLDPPVIMYEVLFERNGSRKAVSVGSHGERLLASYDGMDDD
jgi:hypothetical protein